MMDEHFDRQYQAGRAELHAGIDRLVLRLGREIGAVFAALNRINFSAPWTKSPPHQG